MINLIIVNCPNCSAQIVEGYNFCPNCGKKLKEVEIAPSILGVVWLFVLSTILPPFGLGLTLRYLRSKNNTVKIIGIISLALTVGVLVYAVWTVISVSQNIGLMLNRQLSIPSSGF